MIFVFNYLSRSSHPFFLIILYLCNVFMTSLIYSSVFEFHSLQYYVFLSLPSHISPCSYSVALLPALLVIFIVVYNI